METFGSRLKKLRIKKELTGQELGKLLNVTKMSISRWESDQRFPDKDTLVKIANFFDVSTDYLLGRTENKQGLIVKDKVENDDIELEVDKNMYPDGLTHDEVIKILEGLKAAGVNLKPNNENK